MTNTTDQAVNAGMNDQDKEDLQDDVEGEESTGGCMLGNPDCEPCEACK